MLKKYPWLLPSVFVLSLIGLIVGIFLRAKNAAEVQQCHTFLGRGGQLLSSHVRAACTTAQSMTNIGTILAVGCGIIAAAAIVVAIAQFVMRSQAQNAA